MAATAQADVQPTTAISERRSTLPSPVQCDAINFDVGGTLIRVSRDPHEMALERIAHLGSVEAAALHHHFAVVILSGEAGCAKPHPAIFRAAADGLGVPLARALYVGDSPEHDFHGAASVAAPRARATIKE